MPLPPSPQLPENADQTNLGRYIGYFASEKYDGIHAIWDGFQKKFFTRTLNPIDAPASFTAHFPENIYLDGELWAGYHTLGEMNGTFRTPDPARWRKVKFMCFDTYDKEWDFEMRNLMMYEVLQDHIDQGAPIECVEHAVIKSVDQLSKLWAEVERRGGEGLVLRGRGKYLNSVKGKTLFKLKRFKDAEGVVLPREGGDRASVDVRLSNGATFSLSLNGKPFPSPQTVVKFRYQCLENSGKPRTAVYVEPRPDMTVQECLSKPVEEGNPVGAVGGALFAHPMPRRNLPSVSESSSGGGGPMRTEKRPVSEWAKQIQLPTARPVQAPHNPYGKDNNLLIVDLLHQEALDRLGANPKDFGAITLENVAYCVYDHEHPIPNAEYAKANVKRFKNKGGLIGEGSIGMRIAAILATGELPAYLTDTHKSYTPHGWLYKSEDITYKTLTRRLTPAISERNEVCEKGKECLRSDDDDRTVVGDC